MSFCPAGMEDSDNDSDDMYAQTGWESRKAIRKTSQNQKITIVPDEHSVVGLNGVPFDTNMNVPEHTMFTSLRQTWRTCKNSPMLSQQFFYAYCTVDEPFVLALRFYANCSDRMTAKVQSFAYNVFHELCTFSRSGKVSHNHQPTDNNRMVAFNLVRKTTISYADVCEAYRMQQHAHLFRQSIEDLARVEHCYKEACLWAQELKMFDAFDLYVFVVPLLMQDKNGIAEAFVSRAGADMQRQLIVLLDGLLNRWASNGTPTSVQNRCSELIHQHGYENVNMNKMQAKPLNKLIGRLAKQWHVGQDAMPNMYRAKAYGAFQFLLHKHYYENSLNRESWREMVKETVQKDSKELQRDLISACCTQNDLDEARYWVKFYDVPRSRWPPQLTNSPDKPDASPKRAGASAARDNASRLPVRCLRLDMEREVTLVRKARQYDWAIDELSKAGLVAFDAEWKPTFCAAQSLALIQLSTWRHVYLLDVLALQHSVDWTRLADEVLNNSEITKIAFSPASDLSMFGRCLPGMTDIAQSICSLVDLRELWQLLNTKKFRFPYVDCGADSSGTQLTNLVELCLGDTLDKTNQFSNWERRPLRPDQLHYAALDAFVLLDCFDAMRRCYERDFDEDFHRVVGQLSGNGGRKTQEKDDGGQRRSGRHNGRRGGNGRGRTRRQIAVLDRAPDPHEDRFCPRCDSVDFDYLSWEEMRDLYRFSRRQQEGCGPREVQSEFRKYTSDGVQIEWFKLDDDLADADYPPVDGYNVCTFCGRIHVESLFG